MWLILHSNFHNQDCIFIPMSVFVDLCFSFTPNCVLWYWQWSFENSIIQYYIKKKRKKKAIIVSIHSLLGRNRIHIGWTVCELWQILEKKKRNCDYIETIVGPHVTIYYLNTLSFIGTSTKNEIFWNSVQTNNMTIFKTLGLIVKLTHSFTSLIYIRLFFNKGVRCDPVLI